MIIHPTTPEVIYAGTFGSHFESGSVYRPLTVEQLASMFRIPGESGPSPHRGRPSDQGCVRGIDALGSAVTIMKSTDGGNPGSRWP